MTLKKISITLLLLLTVGSNFAQDYHYQADIPVVSNSGFYKIFLSPEVTSKLQYNFPDIRLWNSSSEEIPFVFEVEKKMKNKDSVVFLTVLKNKHKALKSHTEVLIENDSLKTMANFAFLTDNIGVRKWIKLVGSYDKKEWYIIKDNFPVQTMNSDSSKSEILINNIPESQFKYYKVFFYDYNNTAVNIYSSYTYISDMAQENYVELPQPTISHLDTLNRTNVVLTFDDSQFIDRLKLNVQGPKYFLRSAVLSKIRDVGEEAGGMYYDQIEKEIKIGSELSNTVNLSQYKAKQVKLTIDNRDNQPLRITDVKAYQQRTYIVAYLAAGKSYQLMFSDNQAEFPVYDLEYFTSKIPEEAIVLRVTNIEETNFRPAGVLRSKLWNIPLYYLWIGIGSVGLLLLYISGRVVFEQYRNRTN
ncbi:MAG: hypothetical protein U9N85_03075 [Bacteroidota bacterium]|nr:hypothetical protein [Bacteroidota bacterium]